MLTQIVIQIVAKDFSHALKFSSFARAALSAKTPKDNP